jgi:hypothetical protein
MDARLRPMPRTGAFTRQLALLVLAMAACTVGRVHAGESAEACAERISARVDAAFRAVELDAARAAAIATPQPGMLVTPRALVFVDGPEIPLEWVEWAGAAGVRRMRQPVQTDTLVRVGPGVTLALSNFAGDINVRVWERNEVRIQAEHDRGDRVVARLENAVLNLGVRSQQPGSAEVDWNLTVPVWLPLELSGMEGDIDVAGLRSSVRAQSVRGDVLVRACHGPLEANSVEGEVHVSDVSGNVSAGSINNLIRMVRVTGPVEAQTINGDIQLEKLASPNVDASTVNGRVYFASPYQPRGHYAFASHSGRVYVGLPRDQSVNVTVSSFNGEFESSVPMPAPTAKDKRKGRAVRFMLGDLSELSELARVPQPPRTPRAPRGAEAALGLSDAPVAPELELESFGGQIQLVFQDEALRALDRQRGLLDSARTMLLRSRREEARVRRQLRGSPPSPATAPEAPIPPSQR